jgi:hypothetical protein
MKARTVSVVDLLLLAVWVQGQNAASPKDMASQKAGIVEGHTRLPLAFESNQGQIDSQVNFLSRNGSYIVFLTPTEAVLSLHEAAGEKSSAVVAKTTTLHGATPRTSGVLRMKLLGANGKAEVVGQDELPGKSNYFIGNDPQKWHTNVRQFAGVRYESVYPGVDLIYHGHQRELEWDFVVQPGADPKAIRLKIEGAKKLQLEHGEVSVKSAMGDVRLRAAYSYQEVGGTQHKVRTRYVILSKNEVGFRVDEYDRSRALVIDPVIAYSTLLGGSRSDTANAIAVDSNGYSYVTGSTCSTDFPVAKGLQSTAPGNCDAFITKLNVDGSGLVYSTYLGGSDNDGANGVAIDAAGNAYVTGGTLSTDFPAVKAIQPSFGGGTDAFVAKISPSGNALIYSTYLGGSGSDPGSGIAVDPMGNAYVTGRTDSTDFPTLNALQTANHGGGDAFVTKINAAGNKFVYSTYLGGSDDEEGEQIAVDPAGYAYVTGFTRSTDFPAVNAFQAAYGGGPTDAFVTRISPSGNAFVYSTYLGGNDQDGGRAIAADSGGNAYVAGWTQSTNFPTHSALQPTNAGFTDAFVTKIKADGSALLYSTYLGGSGYDGATGIAVDSSGNVYVTGQAQSLNFPTMNAAQLPTCASDAFVSNLTVDGSALVYSGCIGSAESRGIAVDPLHNAYVAGGANYTLATTLLAFKASTSSDDAFISKVAFQTFAKVSASKLPYNNQVIGTTSATKKVKLTNQGTSSLSINRIYIGGVNPGDFAQTNTCGATLAAKVSCTISATFSPTAKNKRQAALGISDSDAASPQAIALSGMGTVVSLSKSSLSFGNQAVGTSSPPQAVTLTNTGTTALHFSGIKIVGANYQDFTQTNTCGASIAAGANCTITITFKPTLPGARKAAVNITDDGGGSPQIVALTGTGM